MEAWTPLLDPSQLEHSHGRGSDQAIPNKTTHRDHLKTCVDRILLCLKLMILLPQTPSVFRVMCLSYYASFKDLF